VIYFFIPLLSLSLLLLCVCGGWRGFTITIQEMERRGGRGDKVILLGGGGRRGNILFTLLFFVLAKRGVWGE
jgi:hypothetical protein